MSRTFIYTLSDQRDGLIKYVGKTNNNWWVYLVYKETEFNGI